MMKVRVYGQELGARKLSYKSPTIDSKTRTFEVRSLLENSDGRVAPGAMAQIAVTLSEKTALGVPIAAVVERSGRSYVFVAQDDIARMLPVERGIESDGWVAVSGEGIQTDTPIVTRGQSMLDDGSPIRFADQ